MCVLGDGALARAHSDHIFRTNSAKRIYIYILYTWKRHTTLHEITRSYCLRFFFGDRSPNRKCLPGCALGHLFHALIALRAEIRSGGLGTRPRHMAIFLIRSKYQPLPTAGCTLLLKHVQRALFAVYTSNLLETWSNWPMTFARGTRMCNHHQPLNSNYLMKHRKGEEPIFCRLALYILTQRLIHCADVIGI